MDVTKVEISQEQLLLLAKKVIELPDDKITFQTYDDDPGIIKVVGNFPNGYISFRVYYKDSVLGVEVSNRSAYQSFVRNVPISKSRFMRKYFDKTHKTWLMVSDRADQKRKRNSSKESNKKIEEVSRLIDSMFPEELEKALGLGDGDKK